MFSEASLVGPCTGPRGNGKGNAVRVYAVLSEQSDEARYLFVDHPMAELMVEN
jgi:hypothetical protein